MPRSASSCWQTRCVFCTPAALLSRSSPENTGNTGNTGKLERTVRKEYLVPARAIGSKAASRQRAVVSSCPCHLRQFGQGSGYQPVTVPGAEVLQDRAHFLVALAVVADGARANSCRYLPLSGSPPS